MQEVIESLVGDGHLQPCDFLYLWFVFNRPIISSLVVERLNVLRFIYPIETHVTVNLVVLISVSITVVRDLKKREAVFNEV